MGSPHSWQIHTIYLFIKLFFCVVTLVFGKKLIKCLVLVFVAPFSQPCIDIVGWWTPQKEPELTQFTHQLILQLLPTLGIITYTYIYPVVRLLVSLVELVTTIVLFFLYLINRVVYTTITSCTYPFYKINRRKFFFRV